MTTAQRIINLTLIIGLVVALIGGAILFSQIRDTAQSNSTLVCAFGKALSAPLKQRAEESRPEFHRRVKIARAFVRDLREQLDDCNAEQPPVVRVDPESKRPAPEVKRGAEKRPNEAQGLSRKGGGRSSSGPPGSQPTPSPGGGGGPNPGQPGGFPPTPGPAPTPPSPTPQPSPSEGPLRPALDNLTDTVQGTVDSTCDTASGLGVGLC